MKTFVVVFSVLAYASAGLLPHHLPALPAPAPTQQVLLSSSQGYQYQQPQYVEHAAVAPVQVHSAPVQVHSAPVQVHSAPVQVHSAPVQVHSAPVQVHSAPVQVQHVQHVQHVHHVQPVQHVQHLAPVQPVVRIVEQAPQILQAPQQIIKVIQPAAAPQPQIIKVHVQGSPAPVEQSPQVIRVLNVHHHIGASEPEQPRTPAPTPSPSLPELSLPELSLPSLEQLLARAPQLAPQVISLLQRHHNQQIEQSPILRLLQQLAGSVARSGSDSPNLRFIRLINVNGPAPGSGW